MGNAAGLSNTGPGAQGVVSNSSCDRRWLKGGGRRLHPSQHIGNATFAKNLCETLVAVSRFTSHRSQTKTSNPFHRVVQILTTTGGEPWKNVHH